MLDETACRLSYPLDLLNVVSIKENLAEVITGLSFDLYGSIDSTNTAISQLAFEEQHAKVCLAEFQTAGRGRHSRQWLAPYASGLCLSLAWRFKRQVEQIQLISLLPAVALVRVLRRLGIEQVGAKWPNDIICSGRKLAGILIEMLPNKLLQPTIIIGVGLNVYNRSGLVKVPQPITTIEDLLVEVPKRNELAAVLISELVFLLQQAEQSGLESIRDEWQAYDVFNNKPVCFVEGGNSTRGISRGINEDGSLIVETNIGLKSYISGEISLRADMEE